MLIAKQGAVMSHRHSRSQTRGGGWRIAALGAPREPAESSKSWPIGPCTWDLDTAQSSVNEGVEGRRLIEWFTRGDTLVRCLYRSSSRRASSPLWTTV